MKDANEAVVLSSGFRPLYQEYNIGEDGVDYIQVTQLCYFVLAYIAADGREIEVKEAGTGGRYSELKFYGLKPGHRILVSHRENEKGKVVYAVEKYLTIENFKDNARLGYNLERQ